METGGVAFVVVVGVIFLSYFLDNFWRSVVLSLLAGGGYFYYFYRREAGDDETSIDGKQEKVGDKTTPATPLSKRQMVARELLETERNYVDSLELLMTLKTELEEEREGEGEGRILEATDVKLVFGHVVKIHEAHGKMLKELENTMAFWTEDSSIGHILLRQTDDFLKVYPEFINFFEQTKEKILRLEETNARFKEKLKELTEKPEAKKQNLMALMIRPVQRLPSLLLLLQDLIRRTDESSPDHEPLEKALESLKRTVSSINEAKRTTEGLIGMFDILNKIENCPPSLLSSQRSLSGSLDVTEMGDGFSAGENLTLFLFNDSLAVCKRRRMSKSRVGGVAKAPYKFFSLLKLNEISRLVRLKMQDDTKPTFAVVHKEHGGPTFSLRTTTTTTTATTTPQLADFVPADAPEDAPDSAAPPKTPTTPEPTRAGRLCVFQAVTAGNNKAASDAKEFFETLRRNVSRCSGSGGGAGEDNVDAAWDVEMEHLTPEELGVVLSSNKFPKIFKGTKSTISKAFNFKSHES